MDFVVDYNVGGVYVFHSTIRPVIKFYKKSMEPAGSFTERAFLYTS